MHKLTTLERLIDLVKATPKGLYSAEFIDKTGFIFQVTRNVEGLFYVPSFSTKIMPFLCSMGDDATAIEIYNTLILNSTNMCFMFIDQSEDGNTLRVLLNKDLMVTIKRRNHQDFSPLILDAVDIVKTHGEMAIVASHRSVINVSTYVNRSNNDYSVNVKYAELLGNELVKDDIKAITSAITHLYDGVDPVGLPYDLEQRCVILDNGICLSVLSSKKI